MLLVGTLLIGFGLFDMVAGVIDHHLLGPHHVKETVPRDQWIYWDIGFLVWGALMLIVGLRILKRAGRAATPATPRATERRTHSAPRAGGRRHSDPPAPQAPWRSAGNSSRASSSTMSPATRCSSSTVSLRDCASRTIA